MTVFKLPKMTKQEMWKLIRRQRLCRIAFKGNEYPYMAPFQYVMLDGSLYFHFTDYGKKMKLIENDKRVCVEIEEYREDLSEYSFIVLRGTLKVVTAETCRRGRTEAFAKLSSCPRLQKGRRLVLTKSNKHFSSRRKTRKHNPRNRTKVSLIVVVMFKKRVGGLQFPEALFRMVRIFRRILAMIVLFLPRS